MNNLVPVTNPEQEYQQLKTELMICISGGLFLGLYEDNNIPANIIARLQNDLPQQFNFELHLNKDKTNFPIFFRYLFEDLNEQSSVYHVLGIDELESDVLQDFLKNLQYNRDNFKALPYSLIFWIKADFVSTLFHTAPDFYHWLFGLYDFSFQMHQKPEFINYCLQARQELQQQEQQFLVAIRIYLETLVLQYEHWQEVKNDGEDFLNEVMSRADLYNYYVNLHCTDQHNKTWLLDDLLNNFLDNSEQSFLALLGDFGTGKSSFSLHYFIQQVRYYLQDSTRRIPLFISLKDYHKQFRLAEFLEKEFFQRLNLPFHAQALQTLALQGRFLFLFDGFDEMVSMASEQKTIENFKAITRLSFENLQLLTQKNTIVSNKLFLTCRAHYFLTNTQEKDILKADKTVLYRNFTTKTQYQISRMNIKQLKQENIEEYIRKNTDSEIQALEFIKIIKDTYNLTELSTRPLLLDMIVKTLPLLKEKTEINAADLYNVYTGEWIERDDWRSCLTSKGKRQVMWDLAVKMYAKGGDFSLHYSELNTPNKDYFKPEKYDAVHKDYFIYEATTCSFLNRDLTGSYKFIHKSFMEYFFAEYLYYQEKDNDRSNIDNKLLITKEVCFFLKAILVSKKRLHNLYLRFSNPYQIDDKKRLLYIFCAQVALELCHGQFTTDVRDGIIEMIAKPENLIVSERTEAGRILAIIIDARLGLGLNERELPDIKWQKNPRGIATEMVAKPKNLTVSQRTEAGRILAIIGDTRLGVGLNEKGLPDIKWQKIPRGIVTINNEYFEMETFYLAAYLITNVQYQCFIDHPMGYKYSRWWEDLNVKPRIPVAISRWSEANHPRETVSWFEAMAFCAWLSDRLGFSITLPTEWQWQQAACSGRIGFNYPWGKDYQTGYANINETYGNAGKHNEQRTTAVGFYPQGDSLQNVSDLSGNVWEWCLNKNKNVEETLASCALRGGSWGSTTNDSQASNRSGYNPTGGYSGIGFRVCCLSYQHDRMG